MRSKLVKYLVFMLLFFPADNSYGQQVRAVPDSVVRKMKSEMEFHYANDSSFQRKEKPKDNAALRMITALSENATLKGTLYLILAAAFMYVIYQVMVVNDFFIFSRRGNKKKRERIEEESMPDNIDERIDSAIVAREFRLAIRFYYLKTLGLLNKGNKIKLQAKATNYDYIQQMNTYTNAYGFRRLTGIYEYVWYGEFEPDEVQFEQIRSVFNQFNESI